MSVTLGLRLKWALAELSEDIEAIRSMGPFRYLYGRFVYRHHMRFIHKRGRHQMKQLHPMGGSSFSRCDWCGYSDFPTPTEGRPMTGFLATLTPEQRTSALQGYEGDDTMGDRSKI